MPEKFQKQLTDRPSQIKEAAAQLVAEQLRKKKLEKEKLEEKLEEERRKREESVAQQKKKGKEFTEYLKEQLQITERARIFGQALGAKPDTQVKLDDTHYGTKHCYSITLNRKVGRIMSSKRVRFYKRVPVYEDVAGRSVNIGSKRVKSSREETFYPLSLLTDDFDAYFEMDVDSQVECKFRLWLWRESNDKALIPFNQVHFRKEINSKRYIDLNNLPEENITAIELGMLEIYDQFLTMTGQVDI